MPIRGKFIDDNAIDVSKINLTSDASSGNDPIRKSQMDTALGNKADSSHNHDADYAADDHNHDGSYAASSHNHDADYIASSAKGANSGVAELDASGKVPSSQLPGVAITSTYTAANESAQLALEVEEGDCRRRKDFGCR